ncbi:DUF559 domain-containing protein [Pseudonocardia dioxanivorans]|uniref:DUF559 domain-containing protein n=1 Tax=Pseudonocardia dioxanivorans TaxID=240495 RepID=UPI00131A4DDF|nr:DUF559 domain-containing protein [Pseudonocardia dioxanivorans]
MPIDDLLRRQGGLVSVAQARENGVAPRTLQQRARSAGWARLHPGVYLAAGHRLTDEVRVRAAWLWAGPDATVSGPAAAYWLGMLPSAPDPVELTVPARTKPRAQPGVRIRRRDLSHLDRIGQRDIWLTGAALTVLDTAVTLPDGAAFLDRALQRHISFAALHRARCRAIGRRGSPRAGELLTAAADRGGSVAERLLVRLLREAGMRGWRVDHPFQEFRIDIAFPAHRLAIEVDGWAWHVDPARFRADRRKGNALVTQGWTLLRFTWHDLTTDPQAVLATIHAALARAA